MSVGCRPAGCDDIWNRIAAGKVYIYFRNTETSECHSGVSSHNKGYQSYDKDGMDGANTAVSCTRRSYVCAVWSCSYSKEAQEEYAQSHAAGSL